MLFLKIGTNRMAVKPKLFLNWSSGKDAAYTLYLLQQEGYYEVDRLLTTINSSTNRISLHGLSKELLIEQASAIELLLDIISFKADFDAEAYAKMMQTEMVRLKQLGYNHAAFGDIFLEDLRAYREKQLNNHQIQTVFPLWKKDTKQQLKDFISAGFKAVVVSANAKWFGSDFVGKEIDERFLNCLPNEVDPCGENGEFHTFCYDGPIFKRPVKFHITDILIKTYPPFDSSDEDIEFWFAELIPISKQ